MVIFNTDTLRPVRLRRPLFTGISPCFLARTQMASSPVELLVCPLSDYADSQPA